METKIVRLLEEKMKMGTLTHLSGSLGQSSPRDNGITGHLNHIYEYYFIFDIHWGAYRGHLRKLLREYADSLRWGFEEISIHTRGDMWRVREHNEKVLRDTELVQVIIWLHRPPPDASWQCWSSTLRWDERLGRLVK